MPSSLINYERIDPPRFKKDYEGQLLRVLEMPQMPYYSNDSKLKLLSRPDPLTPDGTVFTIRRRYTCGDKQAALICSWPCPCCGHTHEREIREALLAEGKAEFVKESGVAPNPGIILYLASPYTHDDAAVMQQRWLDACTSSAWLIGRGFVVFSPISMGHPIGIMSQGAIGHDFSAWAANSYAMLEASTHLVVNQIPGWNLSTGVRAEIERSRQSGTPIWALVREYDTYRLVTDPTFEDGGEEA